MQDNSKGWKVTTTVEKYDENGNLYETLVTHGNLLLNEGINALFTLLCGGTETPFNNTNARIGVGDSTTAASATQTDLQAATNKAYKNMDPGYPVFGSNQKATFKATFGGTEANFAWNEWVVDNGATAGKTLNRKVESMGTKASGSTWIITVDISLS